MLASVTDKGKAEIVWVTLRAGQDQHPLANHSLQISHGGLGV